MSPEEPVNLDTARIRAAERIGSTATALLLAATGLLPFEEAGAQRVIIIEARNRLMALRHELLRQAGRA